jgi:predicted short-subunit dehydrogenase-like oxidoreductase (DUF2520 family)
MINSRLNKYKNLTNHLPNNYLLIGSGRMAKHFSHYLTLLERPFQQWSRKNNTVEDLRVYAKCVSHVLILINDDAIEDFIHTHHFLLSKKCVHFSGRLAIKNIFSAHPVMTFSENLYEKDVYHTIPFVLEKNGPEFSELLPGLPNRSFKISKDLKSFYHAQLVMGHNFTTLLWQNIFSSIQKDLDLPKDILHPILKQTFSNLMTSPDDALTGPLVRGDKKTIDAHRKALRHTPVDEIYRAFLKLFQQSYDEGK